MLQEGVAESKGCAEFVRGRARAERAIADAYGAARPPAGAWGEAFGQLGGVAAVHAAHSTALETEVLPNLVAQAKAADEALRRTGELAKQLRSEMKATQDTLARAKAELAKRQRASEGAQASYYRATARLLASRGEAGGGGSRAATLKLSKACRALEAASRRAADAEARYAGAHEAAVIKAWQFATLQMPAAVCSLKAAEYARSRELNDQLWKVLGWEGEMPAKVGDALEGVVERAAARKGEAWLEAAL